jgi:hypothetical protein
MTSDISRRDFLKTSSGAAVGFGAASVSPLSSVIKKRQDKSKVVIARDNDCLNSSNYAIKERVQDMVDHTIIELTGINNKPKAYEALFPEPVTASTTITIKENGISGDTSRSYQVVLEALKTGLTSMLNGTFPEDNVTITIGRGSVSPSNPKFYIGNTQYTIQDRWVNSDWIINVPVCWANTAPYGVTLSLKNMMSAVGGNRLEYMHGYEQDEDTPWLAVLNSQPTFKDKHVLTLIDAIMGRYTNGPGGSIDYHAHRIIASRDTIACDYQGIQILKEKGLRASLEQTGLEILAIAVKEPYSLGADDPDMMEVIEISPPWDPVAIESPDKNKGPDFHIKPVPDQSGSQITFQLPKTEKDNVALVISNLQGRRIWTYSGSGVDAVIWKGEDLKGKRVSKGTYIYKVRIGSHEQSGRVQIKR